MSEVKELGYIEKGTGKHQSNVVYDAGGGSTNSNCFPRSEEPHHDYSLCDRYSYCIDANYFKGTSFEEYLRKHRRQLVIECWE